MKKINLLYILIMLVAFVSCNDDDYVAPNSFSDVSWYSPTFKGNDFDRYPLLGMGDYFSIVDISQGEEEHKWELLHDSIFFLEGEIVRNDTTLAEKVAGGGNIGDISEDKTVHLYFPKGGIQSVRLYNTFEEEVNFRAKDTTLTSVFDEKLGLHVFEHIFTVDVYHDVVADYRVYRENGDLIDFSVADTIKIDLANGEKLRFAQNVDSIYHITGVNWNFPKGVPTESFEDSLEVTFYSPGEVKNIALTATRSGQNIPPGNDRVILPLVLNVANGPFAPVEITKGDATSLKVQLSGALNGTLAPSDFTVVAKNSGQNFDIPVSAIAMENNNTLAVLSLGESIYSNDEVHVTYVGTGHKATDGRTLQQETVILAPIAPINLVTDPSFEEGGDTWVTDHILGTRSNSGNFAFSQDVSETGAYSYMVEQPDFGDVSYFANAGSFVLEEGTSYEYSFSFYVESVDKGTKGNTAFEARVSEVLSDTPFEVHDGKIQGGWTRFDNVALQTWISKKWTIVGDGKSYTIAPLMYGNQKSKVYFDNFSVVVVDKRPTP